MLIYVARRILWIATTLVVLSILIFAITQILPGSVARVIAGQFADQEAVDAIAAKLGLNDPFYLQYWRWASSVLRGDLGRSLIMERPIAPILWSALANSALLAGLAFTFVTVVGISLGVLAAVRHNRLVDHIVSLFTFLGISVPEFFWGIVLILIFARYLQWLPAGGAADPGSSLKTLAAHAALPSATLAFALIAHVSRMTRSSMLDVLRSQYVRNARAKGLPEHVVIIRHALRNALLPTITVLAIDVGWLIGGVVVTEEVFAYPGLGRALIFAIERHDLPMIQASILVVAAIYCASNLIADLLYAFFNPGFAMDSAAATGQRFARHGPLPATLLVGLAITATVLLLAALAPAIAPYPYDEMSILARLKPPSSAHWLGTDDFGRDVLSRTLIGARLSLAMGVGATAISFVLAVPLGLLAGYARGWLDEAIMRAMDVVMSFPPVLLGLLILAVTPPSLWKAMVAVGIVYVPAIVRLTRGVTLEIGQEEFIDAARARGDGTAYILFREILPNAWPPLAVEAGLRITFAILLGAALSFLGMGAQPPSSDWGLMISDARPYLNSAPWVVLAPGIAMSITVIGINLLGDGLRLLLDPRLRAASSR